MSASIVAAVSVVPSMVTVPLTVGRAADGGRRAEPAELLVDAEADERARRVLVAELADDGVDGPGAGDRLVDGRARRRRAGGGGVGGGRRVEAVVADVSTTCSVAACRLTASGRRRGRTTRCRRRRPRRAAARRRRWRAAAGGAAASRRCGTCRWAVEGGGHGGEAGAPAGSELWAACEVRAAILGGSAPPSQGTHSKGGETGSMSGAHLLIVDDEENLRSMLGAALRHHGFEVSSVADGRDRARRRRRAVARPRRCST